MSTPAPEGALRLTDWGLISATGADARSFLHGQLTQDVEHLGPDAARLAGYCSAKGRLLASFVVWASSPDELLLACSADLLPATLKRLSMFVLRAKCRLVDASAAHALWGLAGDAARQWLDDRAPAVPWQLGGDAASRVIRLPDARLESGAVPRYLLCTSPDSEAPALPALPGQAWQALEARSGVPRIVAATVEQFVPQMVNLELAGGVSFQKGCYPGQEVVARSQYRGTLKRRGFLVQGDAPIAIGQEVFHSADPGQPAGLIALAGSLDGSRHDALAELKIAATQEGELRLGGPEGPRLHIDQLPYAVPLDDAA